MVPGAAARGGEGEPARGAAGLKLAKCGEFRGNNNEKVRRGQRVPGVRGGPGAPGTGFL